MKIISRTEQTDMERIDKAKLLEVICEASVNLEGNIFYVKRHTDLTILIYDKNNKVLYEPVKPILREINTSKKIEVDLLHSSGIKKNTRVLGKDIINMLKERTL